MKYFQWTIGTTTVRNPDRLRDGLGVLKEHFEGGEWNITQQEKFFNLLRKNRIYEMDDADYERMTAARKQEHARKWVSILNQLGFCFAYESSGKPILITEAGNALLSSPEIEDEIFLRQLLKYQKPCPLPKQSGASFEGVGVLPFVVSLKIVHALEGLSKEEISIFLNTTTHMEDVDTVINRIKKYRKQRNKIEGRVKRKEFYVQTQLDRLREVFADEIKEREALIRNLLAKQKKDSSFIDSKEGKNLLEEVTKGGKGSKTVKARKAQLEIARAAKSRKGLAVIRRIFLDYYLPLKISTLRDYADLTARYLRKSGLFSINRDRLVTITEKKDLIEVLLAQEWKLVRDEDYLDYLWSSTVPALPSDKTDYLKGHLTAIRAKEKELFERVGKRESLALAGEKITPAKNVVELKQQTKVVETNLLHLKEIEFYYSQREEKQIEDIISFYDLILNKQILGGEAYYPAYFEWNTWRVFLAIDTLANKPYEARNFKIDDELQPIGHAPGNRADMVFEYDNFVLATEVTLITRANQWSAEAEPVPRHVARVQSANKSKDVYAVFIAPQIDVNTVLTFFNNRTYAVGGEMLELTIIPLSVDQIKSLLLVFKDKRFTTQDLKRLLESLKSEMTASKDALEWNKKIPAVIGAWTQKL